MVETSVIRQLWRLGWPLAITLQIVALSDAVTLFWLGQMIGRSALAIEATMRYAFWCASWVMAGVATGVSVLVSQSVGARDGRGLTILYNGMSLCIVIWLAAAAVILPASGLIGDAFASREVDAAALRSYFVPWLLVTLPGVGVIQVLVQAASGAGWTRLSLVRSLFDLALIAVTVPLLIGPAGLGVTGAPVGEGIVQIVVAAFIWRTLLRRRAEWSLGEPRRAFDRRLWWQVLDIGMPPQLARVAMLGSYAYFAQRVANDGAAAVAAYGVAFTVVFLAFSATSANGRAAAILVGQAIGAGTWERIRPITRSALWFGIVTSLALVLVLSVFGGLLARVFTADSKVVEDAAATLQVMAWAIPVTALSQVYLYTLTAMKGSKSASLCAVIADAVGVVLALTLPGERELDVIAWSIVASNGLRAGLYFLLWKWRFPILARQAVSSTNRE